MTAISVHSPAGHQLLDSIEYPLIKSISAPRFVKSAVHLGSPPEAASEWPMMRPPRLCITAASNNTIKEMHRGQLLLVKSAASICRKTQMVILQVHKSLSAFSWAQRLSWAQSSHGPKNEPMAYGNHLPAQSVKALQLAIPQPKILEFLRLG